MAAQRVSVPFKAGTLNELNILQASMRFRSRASLIQELVEEALRMPGIQEKILQQRLNRYMRKKESVNV